MKRTCLAIAILSVGAAVSLAARGQGRVGYNAGEASASERSSVGSLVPAPVMSAGRIAHSATALPDGRVLVAGGFLEKGSIKGAEIFDSDAGRFSPLPAMLTTRHSHTATLLPDAKVLIAGGYGEGTTTLATAEIFDSKANSFAPTGSLLAARAGHVAALLDNGKILIAGGLGPEWHFLSIKLHASAETYDPNTGVFSRVGDMGVRRHKHDAVLLLEKFELQVSSPPSRR